MSVATVYQNPTTAVPAYKEQSCFTSDGRQWAWDSTSIRAAQCLKKYQLSILIGLRATKEAAPLTFGIMLHKMWETYWGCRSTIHRADHQEGLRRAVALALKETSWWDEADQRWRPWFTSDPKRNVLTLLRTFIQRADQLQDEAALTLIINGKPAVEQRFRFELDREYDRGKKFVACGYLDRLLTRGDTIEVNDYKHTTAGIDANSFHARYDMDPQMSLYTIGGQVSFAQPVNIVSVDMAQVQIGDTQFLRRPVSRPDAYLEHWMQQFEWLLDEVEMAHATGRWRENDSICYLCQFRDLCRRPPSERERFLSQFEVSHWNPLLSREK